MIGHLDGKTIFKGEKYAILDVGWVGYKIFVAAGDLKNLNQDGAAKLWTHLHVKEDALELYGFLNQTELEFFEMLISISGIGPKSALGVLSLAPVDTIKKAISSGDTSYITKVSGVGRKTAGKIVLELKDKLKLAPEDKGVDMRSEGDALEALVSLGYSERDAREALKRVPEEILGASERVKAALKLLSQHA